ncbi:MAG: response regulator [Nitrosopumilaceae archaeon]|nr:response regulator [Nitrosopumilaceae archaeon]NIX61253.1 response regulator [Nitrosopumilaceae archaeon]
MHTQKNNLKRLLIVDDEESITFTLYQTFINASIDCEVVTASRAEEALQRFEKSPFDIVITDLAMPGMDGLELLAILKKKRPATRVIVITAYGSDDREEKAYNLGADSYFEKPFDIHQLRDLVIQMLE